MLPEKLVVDQPLRTRREQRTAFAVGSAQKFRWSKEMKRPQRENGAIYFLALIFDRYYRSLSTYGLKLILACFVVMFISSIVAGSGITASQIGYLQKIIKYSIAGILIGGTAFMGVDFLMWRRLERKSSRPFFDSSRNAWVGRNGTWLFLGFCATILLFFSISVLQNIFK